ncbi:endothelial cell-selective adhesion molecule-like isoform X1 [Cynoglossus semilaevis]|nr:endothelial cell-selective adhesion molecule-like isoform X1 [Cynoglossus semilaevis]
MVLAKLKRTKLKNLEKEEARVCGAEGGRLVMELKITLTIVKLLMTKMLWTLPGEGQRVELSSAEVEVVKGDMVVFQAWYSPNSDFSKNSVVWQWTGNKTKQVINFSSGEVGLGQGDFADRVGFTASMPSTNLSIYINNTQESDSGRYVCSVLVPRGQGLIGEVQLNVKAPPSPPICSVSGDPVLKGNVTLSCRSTHGKPLPQYKWTKTAPHSEVYFSPMQNERQGSLRLNNLTNQMSGKYVCRAFNSAGSDSCSISLEVVTSSNTGLVAAAALGSVVGLIFMVLLLVFILRRQQRRRARPEEEEEEEMSNEIKEDALAPQRVSWSKHNTSSDSISKDGTMSSVTTSPQAHQSRFLHPYSPVSASDSSSIIQAYHLRPGGDHTLQGLPGYNSSSRKHKRFPGTNGVPPQLLRNPHNPLSDKALRVELPIPPASTTTVMVPSQRQSGSLV